MPDTVLTKREPGSVTLATHRASGANVCPVVLAILVSWIVVICASFGLNVSRYGDGGISGLPDGDRRFGFSDHRDGQPIPRSVADATCADGGALVQMQQGSPIESKLRRRSED